MGEKGNAADVAPVVSKAGDSLVERTTTTATETIVGTGRDVVDAIRDASIGAVADGTVESVRERISRDEEPPPDGGTAETQS